SPIEGNGPVRLMRRHEGEQEPVVLAEADAGSWMSLPPDPISPDREWVLYGNQSGDGLRRLHAVSMDGSTHVDLMAGMTNVDAAFAEWAADGSGVFLQTFDFGSQNPADAGVFFVPILSSDPQTERIVLHSSGSGNQIIISPK